MRRIAVSATALAGLALAGCASFSPDGGFSSVAQTARERLGKDLVWAKSDDDRDAITRRIGELLAKPLSADDAVQIALLHNRGLQASFAELSISEADLVQAGRLPNPTFAMLHTSKPVGDGREYKIEQTLTFNVFALLIMPQASAIERRHFEQTQRLVSLEMLRLASETRKAYYLTLAAEETVRYLRQVREAADAGAELGRRLAQAGNWNKLQQAREQGFFAEAALNLARAERSSAGARERLIRLLGLWGEQTQFAFPQRLPDLPEAPNELPDVEQSAIAQRLDLQAIRLQTEALAKNLGLTKTTRFINVLEIGPAHVLEGTRDSQYKKGYQVSFELPLFDWGDAKVAKAEALYMQALEVAAAAAINARSEVRAAYVGYRASYDIARHYRDEIIPIRKRINEENQLRYNGMLIGVFELLADARSQISSVNSYIESLRDFWLSQADLDMAMLGRPSLTAATMTAMEPATSPPGN